MAEPVFPTERGGLIAGLGILVTAIGLGLIGWCVTESRPPIYMVLSADVSEFRATVRPGGPDIDAALPGQERRPLFAAGLRVRALDWRGVRPTAARDAQSGGLSIGAGQEPFGLTMTIDGTIDLQVVAHREGRLSLFIAANDSGRVRMELDPTITGCFRAVDLELPPGWLADDGRDECGRPSRTAGTLLVENVGDSRLEVTLDDAPGRGEILALPWTLTSFHLEEFEPQDGSTRRFIRSGTIRLDTRDPISARLDEGDSLAIVPVTGFALTRLKLGSNGRGLAMVVVGEADVVRLGPDPQSRRDLIPTRLVQWWQDEAFRWRIAGLGGLITTVGFLLLQLVGWYQQARQIEASRGAAVDLELRIASLEIRQGSEEHTGSAKPAGERSVGAEASSTTPGPETIGDAAVGGA